MIIAVVLLLAAALVAYFLFFKKAAPGSQAGDQVIQKLPAGLYDADDEALFKSMLQAFKTDTGVEVPNWILQDLQSEISAGNHSPDHNFNGKPSISGELLQRLESEFYGYGYVSKEIDDKWHGHLYNMFEDLKRKKLLTTF